MLAGYPAGMLHDHKIFSDFQSLTDKQREALDLLVDVRTSKEIARELGISPSAVEFRLKAARDKVGVPNRRELVRLYKQMSASEGCDEGDEPKHTRLHFLPPCRRFGPLSEATFKAFGWISKLRFMTGFSIGFASGLFLASETAGAVRFWVFHLAH